MRQAILPIQVIFLCFVKIRKYFSSLTDSVLSHNIFPRSGSTHRFVFLFVIFFFFFCYTLTRRHNFLQLFRCCRKCRVSELISPTEMFVVVVLRRWRGIHLRSLSRFFETSNRIRTASQVAKRRQSVFCQSSNRCRRRKSKLEM